MATATWGVRVELATTCAVTDDVLDELTDRLAGLGAAVAMEDDGHVAVQLTVDAGTMRAAFLKGEKAVADAVADLLEAQVVEVQVLTWAEFERRMEQPRVPELWGRTEVAEFLQVHPTRVHQLAKEHPEKLPMVTKLAGKQGAVIWLKNTWVRFEKSYKRNKSYERTKSPASVD